MKTVYQRTLFDEFDPVRQELEFMANAGQEERGAIFTKREVVRFILDLAEYSPKRALLQKSILEPSFGHGEFLLEIVDRLAHSLRRNSAPEDLDAKQFDRLKNAIRGVELHRESFAQVKLAVFERLKSHGFPISRAESLVAAWLHQGDYLLSDFEGLNFDFVVGNPPYVRQEMIPDSLLAEYRSRYATMYDRADLYVPFIERSLGLLKHGGTLAFICADRWTKNKYGQPLREMVSKDFHLAHFVAIPDSTAFHAEVSAYPAVVVISRDSGRVTRVANVNSDLSGLDQLSRQMKRATLHDTPKVMELDTKAFNGAPWILTADPATRLVRDLEQRLPLLEDAGCKVGIGVATGADKVFVGQFNELDVEDSRKLPLAMTRDIREGKIEWRGKGVINPFLEDGTLAAFGDFPRMGKYFTEHAPTIMARNVAKRNRPNWYRTIDRIYPKLATEPKLLIPDIRGQATVVLEHQGLYPHHNLYYVTAPTWDLRVLQAVLLSGLAKLFVSAYSTRMRGGFLRYQAQYLRRVRIPEWRSIPAAARRDLRRAMAAYNLRACNEILARVIDLSPSEKATLERVGP